jgi:Icc-related predicted phosphoesterase
MKIMVMADNESKLLYDYYEPERMKDIDLIISCGDLNPEYLSFFATVCHAPVVYVMGNHDGKYSCREPEGCLCIEDDIYEYKGVRILGLGGCMQYIPGAENQYKEKDMRSRIRKLRWKLWRKKGFDILVTHAPAKGVNDMEDLPHQGFQAFCDLMKKYAPTYFIHGHVHANYGSSFKRKDTYGSTRVINAYEFYVIDYPPEE